MQSSKDEFFSWSKRRQSQRRLKDSVRWHLLRSCLLKRHFLADDESRVVLLGSDSSSCVAVEGIIADPTAPMETIQRVYELVIIRSHINSGHCSFAMSILFMISLIAK